LGSQHQIDQHNNIAEETALLIVGRETTATINEIAQTRTENETNVSQQISVTEQTMHSVVSDVKMFEHTKQVFISSSCNNCW
jgi:uncharacterized membrane protein YfhO